MTETGELFTDMCNFYMNTDIVVDNYQSTLLNWFNKKINVDCEVVFLLNNEHYHSVMAHKCVLIKCHYFKNLFSFYGTNTNNNTNKLYILITKEIEIKVINLFFQLLYDENNDCNEILDENILDFHYLSNYLVYDKLKILCEERICLNLTCINWIIFIEYCLNLYKMPYSVITGTERLFSYIIRWLRCYHVDSDDYYTINTLFDIIFPYYIENFIMYDLLKPYSYVNNTEYIISFGNTLCYHCSLFQYNKIMLMDMVQFDIKSDNFKISIIKTQFDSYHLYIKRESLNQENIKYNLTTFIYKFTNKTTLLNPYIYRKDNIDIPYNQFIKIGDINYNNSILHHCNLCKNKSMESIGIKFRIQF